MYTAEISLLTSRERDEGCALPKLPVFVQKVSRVESVGRLPLVLVKQHRGQIGNDCNSLVVAIVIINNYRRRDKRLGNLCVSYRRNDLGDGVSFQLDGFGGEMRQAEGSYVAEPLNFVDDSIGVWKVHAVIHSHCSRLSDHPVNLGLNLFCVSREDTERQNTCV